MGVQSQLSNRMPVKSGVDKNGGFQYTPHKRRGPIAAEFQSPGPAAISLAGSVGRGPSKSMGIKPKAPKKYITPAPSAYEPEKGEEYLAEHIKVSMGIKPKDPKKYITPAPSAYEPEKCEEYLAEHIKVSMGIKPKDSKKYITPAPSDYEPEKGEEYLAEHIKVSMGIKPKDPK